MEVKDFFQKNFTFAIVGASNDKEKYGHKVLVDLKRAGYNVIPINPKEAEIEGIVAYPNLESYKGDIDVVVFIVPPQVTLKVLQNMSSNINKVWMQPGASNNECVQYCKDKNLNFIHDMCVMVEKPR